jgi:hypothetical protein
MTQIYQFLIYIYIFAMKPCINLANLCKFVPSPPMDLWCRAWTSFHCRDIPCNLALKFRPYINGRYGRYIGTSILLLIAINSIHLHCIYIYNPYIVVLHFPDSSISRALHPIEPHSFPLKIRGNTITSH